MRFLISLTILAGLLPVASFAENLSDTDCGTHTYAYYELNYNNAPTGAPQPCANGILNYSNFQLESFGTGGATLVDAANILISAIGPGRLGFGDTGFTLSGLSVEAGQTATYVFDWRFVIDSGPYAGGGKLGMDPPFGDVTFFQSYCVDSFMSAYTSTAPATCSNQSDFPPPLQTLTVTVANPDASILFDPIAQNFATMRTIIQLNGGQTGAGYDLLIGTTGIYDSGAAPAPEPGTLLLIPAGLLMAGFLRKRTAKR